MTQFVTASCCYQYSLLRELAHQVVQHVKATSIIHPDCLIRRVRDTSYRVTKLVYPETRVLGNISTFPWLRDRNKWDDRILFVQSQHLKPNLAYAIQKETNGLSGSSINFTSDYASDPTFHLATNHRNWSPLFPGIMMEYKIFYP